MSPLYEDEERALDQRVDQAFWKAWQGLSELQGVIRELRETRQEVHDEAERPPAE